MRNYIDIVEGKFTKKSRPKPIAPKVRPDARRAGPPENSVRVVVHASETCTDSERSGDRYGSWSESYDFDIRAVYAVGPNYTTSYGEEVFLVPQGTKLVHVLTMTYDDGDSFGNATGKGVVLGAFADARRAVAAEQALKKNPKSHTITVLDDFGRSISISNPGAGYFETVTGIDIRPFDIDADASD